MAGAWLTRDPGIGGGESGVCQSNASNALEASLNLSTFTCVMHFKTGSGQRGWYYGDQGDHLETRYVARFVAHFGAFRASPTMTKK